jgi:hypothetical protein
LGPCSINNNDVESWKKKATDENKSNQEPPKKEDELEVLGSGEDGETANEFANSERSELPDKLFMNSGIVIELEEGKKRNVFGSEHLSKDKMMYTTIIIHKVHTAA